MRSKLIIFALMLSGCTLLTETDQKYLPEFAESTAIVLQTRIISTDATTAVFESDVVLINKYQFYLSYFEKKNFELAGVTGASTTIQAFDLKQFSLPARTAAAVLINQSANYELYDPLNSRSKSLNKLIEDISTTPLIVGGFAKSGLVSEPVEFGATDLTSDYAQQLPFLFGLAKRTGGINNMAEAISTTIDKLKISKNAADIFILTDGADQASATSFTQLATKAASNNIRLHITYLGTQAPVAHGILASKTNGSFAVCADQATLITTLAAMDMVSHDAPRGYRLRISYKKNVGTLAQGEELSVTIKIKDSFDGYEFNPLILSIKLP